MPWHIEKRDNEFCVIKDSDGSSEGCHSTRDAAEKQMSALYASEDTKTLPSNHLKTISKSEDELRVGNYIVMFGGRDLEWVRSGPNEDGSKGEYFTKNTVLDSPYTSTGVLHVDWEHGIGKAIDGSGSPGKDDVLGTVDWKTARVDDHGVWVERVLNRRNKYMEFIETLVDEGLIGTSSEAVEDGVKRGKNGEIKAWPLRRDTLTVSPADWRMMTENAVEAIKTLADVYPGLKAILPEVTDGDGDAMTGEIETMQLQAQALLLTLED